MKHRPWLAPSFALLMLVTSLPPAGAQTAPTTQPATAPAATISAGDKQALAAHQGQDVVVVGTVASAELSSSGRIFRIHLQGSDKTRFQAVVFQKNLDKFNAALGGDLAKAVVGKAVRLSGKLADYRGAPEIILDDPSQVSIDGAAP